MNSERWGTNVGLAAALSSYAERALPFSSVVSCDTWEMVGCNPLSASRGRARRGLDLVIGIRRSARFEPPSAPRPRAKRHYF